MYCFLEFVQKYVIYYNDEKGEELNEKYKDNYVNSICRNIICLKRASSCVGTLESYPQD